MELVATGSIYRVYLPEREQWITFSVAGITCPRMKGKLIKAAEEVKEERSAGESKGDGDEVDDEETGSESSRPVRRSKAVYEPEPYGREAKHFVESRLLQRDVHITITGMDKFQVSSASQ